MSGEIVREWHFWLVSIATGAFLAFVYDVIRLIRRLIRHGRLAVDLEDMLYWTACFGLSFTLLYYGNNGVIRFAAVLGAAVGMVIYAVTVGRFFVRAGCLVIDRTVGSLIRLLRKMIRKLCRLLVPVRCVIVKNFNRLFQKIRLTCTANRHKMKERSHKGADGGRKETADGKGKSSKRQAKRKENSRKRRSDKTEDAGVSARQK